MNEMGVKKSWNEIFSRGKTGETPIKKKPTQTFDSYTMKRTWSDQGIIQYSIYEVLCRKQQEATHLFIPSKTATLVSEFAVEDLPLNRIATLVPAFGVKDLPLGRTL